MTVVAALPLSACAGGASRAGFGPPVARAAGPDRWRALGWEERHARMTWGLLPAMARRFRAFEGTPEPRLACVTCHGRDAEEVAYRMPHGLPPLDPANLPDPASRTVRFMREIVVPLTDRLLEAGGTITCFSCHPSAAHEARLGR